MKNQDIIEYLKIINNESSTSYVTAQVLADNFQVSEKTIRKRIKQINEDEVIIYSKKSRGYKLIGSYTYQRKQEKVLATDIIEYLLLSKKSVNVTKLLSDLYLTRSIAESTIQEIKKYGIDLQIKKSEINLVYSQENIVKLLNFLYMYKPGKVPIETISNLSLTQYEKRYLGLLELYFDENENYPIIYNAFMTISDEQYLKTIVSEVLSNSRFNTLFEIEFLVEKLSLHLSKVFEKVRLKIYIENPMCELIENKYHRGNYYANLFAKLFERKTGYDLPREEIAYLTLYFENIIHTNQEFKLKIAYLSSDKLSLYYNNVHELSNSFPQHTFIDEVEKQTDLIIGDNEKSHLIFKGMIDGQVIEQIDLLIKFESLRKRMNQVLNIKVVKPKDKYSTLDQVLTTLNLNDEVHESIIEREKLSSTSLYSQTAIPHPLIHATDNPSYFELIVLDKPVSWDQTSVKYLVIFILNFNESRKNAMLLKYIYDIFTDIKQIEQYLKYIERGENENK